MNDVNKYDLMVKDLFQRDRPSLLDQLTGGVAVREVLNVELTQIVERRADLVFLLADKTILHIEFQSTNDRDMPYREGMYCLMLGKKYRCRVKQVVVYVGFAKMKMDDHIDLGETRCAYQLLDIREMDARKLLDSGRPADLALALLARGGTDHLLTIAKRAAALSGTERQRVLTQLAVFSGLRRMTGRLKMEWKNMGSTTDFYQNEFVKDIVRDTEVKTLRTLLAIRFGDLPVWVDDRLAKATSAQAQRWLRKIVAAETLEGVLGRK